MAGRTSSTITACFLILSDSQNSEFDDKPRSPFHPPLPKVDVVLHCGDLTHFGGALKMLGAIDAELKLAIAGNQYRDLDKQYWDTKRHEDEELEDHAQAFKIMTGALAAEAGVKYLEEGTYKFTLKNGAKSSVYVSPYTPEF